MQLRKNIFNLCEIGFYLINLVWAYGFIYYRIGKEVAQRCNSSYHCRSYIMPSMVPYAVDVADNQWRDFRGSLPLLCTAAVFVCVLHYALHIVYPNRVTGSGLSVSSCFHFIVGIVFVIIQHSYHAAVIFAILLLNYMLVYFIRSPRTITTYTWLYALAIVALKESHRLRWDCLYFLFDRSFSGMYSWQYPANFLLLRIISYNIDYCRNPTSSTYNVINYISYCLYAPLYVAGPIISFDRYVSQSTVAQRSPGVWLYALRWCLTFALMEFLTSQFPFFAIIKSGLFLSLSPAQMIVTAYGVLKLMWLKFLLIWRLFRLWSLVDGIDPPENMLTCMSNNYSIEYFWKGWHSSFNKWILQYMYIPLGGRNARSFNVWPIFLFVAIWHDIEVKLMVWGVLNATFYVLEMYGKRIYKNMATWNSVLRDSIGVVAAALYIIVLVSVNLIGYAIGAGNFAQVVRKFSSLDALKALGSAFYFLCVGVCIMNCIKRYAHSDQKIISNSEHKNS